MISLFGKIFILVLFLVLVVLIVTIGFNNHFLPDPIIERFNCTQVKAGTLSPFGIHVPEKIKLPVKRALQYYPELESVKISFIYASISSSMEARPVINYKVFDRNSREYIIRINDNRGKIKGVCFDSCNERIIEGWVAHEFSHILDYRNKSALGLLAFAINYYFLNSFKRKVEKMIDISVINRGLGPELKEGLEYSLQESYLSESYKQNIRDNYMSTRQIDSLITIYNKHCPPNGILRLNKK